MLNENSKISENASSRVIVIGTSAGGLQVLTKLVSQFQSNFPAPVLVVQHISADATGNVLLETLNKLGTVKCEHAKNGRKLKAGHLYLAPTDHHLMIDGDSKVLITKGAQENRFRPAIDPLFRSAGIEFGNMAIGIILSGYLDDGTSGMKVIQRCGGICIVQDPTDAQYPEMPKNVLNQMKVDHCVPVSEMGQLLYRLLAQVPGKKKPIPKDISIEAEIAKHVLSDLPSVNALGDQVPFNCPGCGGVLWQITKDSAKRYRCHTGHAYTAATLLAEQTKKIEETMWVALRMFEERKNLLTTVAKDQTGAASRSAQERAAASQIHIDRIKSILYSDDNGTGNNSPS